MVVEKPLAFLQPAGNQRNSNLPDYLTPLNSEYQVHIHYNMLDTPFDICQAAWN